MCGTCSWLVTGWGGACTQHGAGAGPGAPDLAATSPAPPQPGTLPGAGHPSVPSSLSEPPSARQAASLTAVCCSPDQARGRGQTLHLASQQGRQAKQERPSLGLGSGSQAGKLPEDRRVWRKLRVVPFRMVSMHNNELDPDCTFPFSSDHPCEFIVLQPQPDLWSSCYH